MIAFLAIACPPIIMVALWERLFYRNQNENIKRYITEYVCSVLLINVLSMWMVAYVAKSSESIACKFVEYSSFTIKYIGLNCFLALIIPLILECFKEHIKISVKNVRLVEKTNRRNTIVGNILVVCYFILMLLLHMKMSVVSDDVVFKDYLIDSTVFQFVKRCYLHMTGKFLTDPLGAVLVKAPFMIWKVLDTCICTVAYCMIGSLLLNDEEQLLNRIFVFLIMLMFPVYYLMSAGFILTSTNYLYTSFGMLWIAVIFKLAKMGRIWSGDILMLAIASLYAANQEQSACVLIGLLTVYALFLTVTGKENKKIFLIDIYTLICSCIGFALVCLSPGHIVRTKTVEGTFCVPGYADWSAATKIFKGYTTTVANLLYYPTWIYVMLCVLVCVLGMLNGKRIVKGIAAIPLLFCLGSYNIWSHLFAYYPEYGFAMMDLNTYHNLAFTVLTSLLPLILFLIICITVISSCESKVDGGTIVLLLSVGLASRVMMGFSPTLFGSSFRTFTYLLLLMQVDCILIFKEIQKKNNKMASLIVLFVAAGLAAYMYVHNHSVLDRIAEEGWVYYFY